MKSPPEQVTVTTPRNMKQLRNLRYKHLNQTRISRDALYNMHELAYDIPGFIRKMTTYPDLVCICGLQEILEEANKVLQLKSPSQLLSYDTTFKLGDFSVSPLLFKHMLFKEAPCIPAMFLIHERKYTETHIEVFRECIACIPTLKKAKCPIVTDREKAIVNAVKESFPVATLVHCWNHLLRDMRTWLHQHGAPTTDIAVYQDDAFELFHQLSEGEYDKLLAMKRQAWDTAFEEYWMKNIHPDVPNHIGRWVLEDLQVYNPYSGVTNNQSEFLNRVFKDIQEWKEAPIDCTLLAIYQLQAFYSNEIKRGFSGMGEYHLCPEFQSLQHEYFAIEYIPTCSPEEIVQRIQRREIEQIPTSPAAIVTNDTEGGSLSAEQSRDGRRALSIQARACEVVNSGNSITFDSNFPFHSMNSMWREYPRRFE